MSFSADSNFPQYSRRGAIASWIIIAMMPNNRSIAEAKVHRLDEVGWPDAFEGVERKERQDRVPSYCQSCIHRSFRMNILPRKLQDGRNDGIVCLPNTALRPSEFPCESLLSNLQEGRNEGILLRLLNIKLMLSQVSCKKERTTASHPVPSKSNSRALHGVSNFCQVNILEIGFNLQ